MAKLTLSSNSTDFTTYLNPPIKMESGRNYEVAFISLMTYNSIPNITEANNKFKYSTDNGSTWKIITLSKGAYELKDINAAIQREMQVNGDLDEINGKYYINISHLIFKTILTISHEKYMVDFGIENSIGSTLGFTNEGVCLSHGTHQSPNIIDIEKVNSIQVHCDIAVGNYLNGNKSNVIHTFTQRVNPGYKIIENPTPELIFLPIVNRPEIDSINLRLTDQDNNLIDLMGERLTIVLLIRVK